MGVKEKDLPSTSTLGSGDFLRCVMAAGASKKIPQEAFTAQRIEVSTTAPTGANTNGYKLVLLSSEPATKYNGWIYLIEEQ